MVDYYAERAKGGIGTILVEAMEEIKVPAGRSKSFGSPIPTIGTKIIVGGAQSLAFLLKSKISGTQSMALVRAFAKQSSILTTSKNGEPFSKMVDRKTKSPSQSRLGLFLLSPFLRIRIAAHFIFIKYLQSSMILICQIAFAIQRWFTTLSKCVRRFEDGNMEWNNDVRIFGDPSYRYL